MKIAAIFVIIVTILLASTFFFAREVFIQKPVICKYCHFITPYYNKWERSAHNSVPCLKCHEYGPLNALSGQLRYIAGTYNPRPFTNVPDGKCLQPGCHERRLVESRVSFTKWNIAFDHRPHFTEHPRGINLHCRSCHSDIAQGEHMKVSLNVCFLCHLSGGENIGGKNGDNGKCMICHSDPKKIIMFGGRGTACGQVKTITSRHRCEDCHLSVKMGDGTVPRERCFFCHIDRADKYDDPAFVHSQHIGKKQIDCFFCHQLVQHSNVRMAKDIDRMSRKVR